MSETSTLLEVLKRHYIKPGGMPGGIFLPECGINGAIGSRADALYVGFTSASGRLLVGHELKVSRPDWRRELDKAGKADFWADNCHQWIIVAPGPHVVPAEEVPHGWGLMYPSPRTKTRMQIVIKPTTHADRTPSWQAVRSIMARLDTLQAQQLVAIHQEAREKAEADAERKHAARAEAGGRLTGKQSERLQALDALERVFGGEIVSWALSADEAIDARKAGAALRLVAAADALGIGHSRYAVDELQRVAKELTEGLQAFAEARDALLEITGERRG